jgi:hypothetical protein
MKKLLAFALILGLGVFCAIGCSKETPKPQPKKTEGPVAQPIPGTPGAPAPVTPDKPKP